MHRVNTVIMTQTVSYRDSRKHERILDGRRSFPSGHSASAFMGLGFLFLMLAGQTGSLRLNGPSKTRSFLSSKILWLTLTLIPLVLASWIAITRLQDYVRVLTSERVYVTTENVARDTTKKMW